MPWDTAIAAFGITAALLLVGGAILLRYQRDRYHFLLMQSALSHGITSFPGTPPAWLVSLRVGVLAFVLGLGLIGAGAALYRSANQIEELPATFRAINAPPNPINPPPYDRPPNPNPVPPAGMMDPNAPGNPPPPPPPPPRAPNAQGPNMNNPPRPPGPNPVLERWHRIQNYRTAGLITGCAGAILAALGIVRIFFARLERKYASPEPASPPPAAA